MSKFALIDSGTNTFSLIIFELSGDNKFKKIHKESAYVYLADDGLNIISEAAQKRAIDAYLKFAEIIDSYKVDKIKAIGTAIWRNAQNGQTLVSEIYHQTSILIEIIDGSREAELIYKGVALTLAHDGSNNLIIDIGGGSVEFIIGSGNQMKWSKSFDLGAALLFNKFNVSDPIKNDEIENIKLYVRTSLRPLELLLNKFPVNRLIAASGTMDALLSMLGIPAVPEAGVAKLKPHLIRKIYLEIISKTLEQRLDIPGMPISRAKLLPVALTILDAVLEICNIDESVYISDYALHEGIMTEIIK